MQSAWHGDTVWCHKVTEWKKRGHYWWGVSGAVFSVGERSFCWSTLIETLKERKKTEKKGKIGFLLEPRWATLDFHESVTHRMWEGFLWRRGEALHQLNHTVLWPPWCSPPPADTKELRLGWFFSFFKHVTQLLIIAPKINRLFLYLTSTKTTASWKQDYF